ncbi:hypothetical protein P153DRAFT_371158 [Dothidotthia symphoricarpi CBS 119687]|uniref:Uncharacterized protein n=1 Tax=Dothidotthia symphoricarpi CBS 119687 TaxID=1392245 RepID=A0A6A5ZZ59_9PLEO|nr:uncharacterized protein P153DRAFT_371158 [Dothidotthia symphoricarpi CBS 119687]KAF2124305.1 hypothetical protein P153DRAFT_371158 [Dothidotthia symphoricarpi CBS 119687]
MRGIRKKTGSKLSSYNPHSTNALIPRAHKGIKKTLLRLTYFALFCSDFCNFYTASIKGHFSRGDEVRSYEF